MDLSPFVSSEPAVRCDGWSPERKLRFLNRLAASGNVSAACAAVGMSRDAAYVLRRRDKLFARGWASALLLARERSVELLADKATEGIEEEVWYRGEMVGTRRRFDARLLLAHLARLDRMAQEALDDGAGEDAERFDALLACIAGVEVPEELRDERDPVPSDREATIAIAEEDAGCRADAAWAERARAAAEAGEEAGEDSGEADGEAHAEWLRERDTAVAAAGTEAAARWDAWFRLACAAVDQRLAPGGPQPEAAESDAQAAQPSPGTVSDVSVSPGHASFVGPDGRRYARS